MTTVYIVYNESGEYSDYGMGIDGVFSTVEEAKKAIENAPRYNRHTWGDWCEEEGGFWHRDEVSEDRWGRMVLTIAPFEIDAELDDERR